MKTFPHLLFTLSLAVLPAASSAQCPKGSDCKVAVKPASGTAPGTTTTVTYDNRAHAEEVGQAASRLTTAGLNYFLIIRPALQTAENEAMNQREGHFTPTYRMLDDLAQLEIPGQSEKTVEGQKIQSHFIGQTWEQFLDSTPSLRSATDKCVTQKRPDPNKRKKKVDFNPCAALWLLIDKISYPVTLTCLEPNMRPGKDMVCRDFNGEFTFRSGSLVALKLVLSNEWTEVYPDIVAKFGQPQGQDDQKTLGIWTTEDSHLVALQIDEGTALSWISHARYLEAVEESKRQKAARVSSLD